MKIRINGKNHQIDAAPEMPLLWVLRDLLDLTGTKYGCGIGQCGACTILLDGKAKRSCTTPLSAVGNQEVTTIEGLAKKGEPHPIQKAWVNLDVPQCGYCQSGQIMSAVSLLAEHPNPDNRQIDEAMKGNICRCGTYMRIRKAIKTVAQEDKQ